MEQDLKEDLPTYYYHSYEMSKTAKISFFKKDNSLSLIRQLKFNQIQRMTKMHEVENSI